MQLRRRLANGCTGVHGRIRSFQNPSFLPILTDRLTIVEVILKMNVTIVHMLR